MGSDQRTDSRIEQATTLKVWNMVEALGVVGHEEDDVYVETVKAMEIRDRNEQLIQQATKEVGEP